MLSAAIAVISLWRPPGLALKPEGIVRPLGFRTRLTRWDDLPGPVVVTGGRLNAVMNLDDPRRPVIPGWLTTDLRYIAAAIEYYRVRPQERAAIGTAAEHERPSRALSLLDAVG